MVRLLLVASLAMAMVSAAFAGFATCKRDYRKIGCFWEKNTNMDLIINDRDPSSPAYQGHMLDWGNFGASIHSLACRCSALAKSRGYTYFSIRFWAECWAGMKREELEALVKDPSKATNQCANDSFKTCDDAHEGECVGRRNAEYIYDFPSSAEQSVDGGWSDYSEWSECSMKCGPGIQTRERTCTNPEPEGPGASCVGESTETKSCQVKECPVDGGFSEWSKFTTCTRSCGGGSQERVRFCNSPSPAHGGKNCTGKAFEIRSCGSSPCPIDGGFTKWSKYSNCTKSCGQGTKTRSRSCTNPSPAHGGKPCNGNATQTAACNNGPCKVDGGFTKWSKYSACTKSCGVGTKTRTRSCTAPAPAHGGKNCTGSTSDTVLCNTHKCPTRCDGTVKADSGCCTSSKQCGLAEGDCDSDSDCKGNLICGTNNCNTTHTKFTSTYDCCKERDCTGKTIADANCCTKSKPCSVGEGDCDYDSDCVGDLVCGKDSCNIKGTKWSSTYDCCQKRACDGKNYADDTCCTKAKPCKEGEGDCDSDSDCAGDLVCGKDNCKIAGTKWTKTYDCCAKKVDGKLSSWSSWGSCSATCGPSTQTRTRTCTPPQNGGKACSGALSESRKCNYVECPEKCRMANWWGSMDKKGWSMCGSSNEYLSGLWRNDRDKKDSNDGLYRIEEARCCGRSVSYGNEAETCYNVNWWGTFDKSHKWGKCKDGYFLRGLYRSSGSKLHNLEEGKCCKPTSAPNSYLSCYDATSVGLSFDKKGLSKCNPGYLMTGLYRGGCDNLYCIEKFRCCSMKPKA